MASGYVLARSSFGSVVKCHSGIFHVHVSGTTVHFKEENFMLFCKMMNIAYENYIDVSFQGLINKDSDI